MIYCGRSAILHVMYVAVEGLPFIKPTSISYICDHWASAAFKMLHVWIIVTGQINKKKKRERKDEEILAA